MGKQKRVCVYMQLYRNEPTMHKAIKSVLQQTYENLRFCILVSHATKQTVEEYGAKDSRIQIFDGKPDESVAAYYNRQKEILREGHDAYYTVIDADDWYDVRYIETLIDFAERHDTQITACGNYFVDHLGKCVEERRQQEIIWEPKDTAKLLPHVYGFLRTIWGKLFTSDIILNQKIEELPDQKQYGGYGGDTLYMFNILPDARRLGLCSQSLYYYRMSATGGTYTLREGRLDSDVLVFHFVKNTLQKLGDVGELPERYLFLVYGNAVKDSTALLTHQSMDISKKTDNLRYLLDNELARELLAREKNGQLQIWEGGPQTSFAAQLYKLVFSSAEYGNISPAALENYLWLFDSLCEKWQGAFSAVEFSVLWKEKRYLDTLMDERYGDLFEMLLALLPKLKGQQLESCLCLLRRLSRTVVLKPVLTDKDFVVKYANLIQEINRGNNAEAFGRLHRLLSASKAPYCAEALGDLWINLAAVSADAEEFILGKEFRTVLFLKSGDPEKARQQYEELEALGIQDDNMKALAKYFQQ